MHNSKAVKPSGQLRYRPLFSWTVSSQPGTIIMRQNVGNTTCDNNAVGCFKAVHFLHSCRFYILLHLVTVIEPRGRLSPMPFREQHAGGM